MRKERRGRIAVSALSSGLPEKEGELSDLEENVLLRLVDDVRAEISADNTIPSSRSVDLIENRLHVVGD